MKKKLLAIISAITLISCSEEGELNTVELDAQLSIEQQYQEALENNNIIDFSKTELGEKLALEYNLEYNRTSTKSNNLSTKSTTVNGVNRLELGDQLAEEGYLISSNNEYKLIHQNDGNVVLYKGLTQRTSQNALWATNTAGKNTTLFRFQTDGELVLKNNNSFFWAAGTWKGWRKDSCLKIFGINFGGCHEYYIEAKYAVLQGDGNFVIYGDAFIPQQPGFPLAPQISTNTPLWATNTYNN